ncbi:MAG: hypothetical protein Q8Q11_00935 [bacterium]|nr:hypothetical protein [bacterium]MDZ4248236.1 hypothetical protein [Patescibacteria group bacterium]
MTMLRRWRMLVMIKALRFLTRMLRRAAYWLRREAALLELER